MVPQFYRYGLILKSVLNSICPFFFGGRGNNQRTFITLKGVHLLLHLAFLKCLYLIFSATPPPSFCTVAFQAIIFQKTSLRISELAAFHLASWERDAGMQGSMREGDKPCGWDPNPPAPMDGCPLSLPECRWVISRKVETPRPRVRGAQLTFELIGLTDSHAGRNCCFTSDLSAELSLRISFILYLKIEGRKRADSQGSLHLNASL